MAGAGPVSPDIVGPVTLDQIARGIDSGKLDARAEVSREGSDEWAPAVQFVSSMLKKYGSLSDAERDRVIPRELPPAVVLSDRTPPRPGDAVEGQPQRAMPPPRGKQSSSRPVKKARRLGWPMAIGVGVLTLVGGIVAAYFLWLRNLQGGEMTLPVLAQKLPGSTVQVVEAPLRSDLSEVAKLPPEYVASSLAEVACGGVDVGLKLALARGKDLKELKRLGVLDMLVNESTAEALQCGSAFAKALQSPSVVSVSFTDGDKVRLVSVIRASLTDFPSQAFERHNFSGLPGFCKIDEKKKSGCDEEGRAAFRDEQLWVLGYLTSVEAFARAYTTANEELTTNVEILTQLVQHMRPADHSSLVARPESVPWKAPCTMVAPVGKDAEFTKSCFPEGQDRVLESIETKLRGLAVQRDMLGRAKAFRWEYVLLARDEEAATRIENDLADLTRDWRAHLTNHEPELVRLARAESDYTHDRFWEAALEPFLRALRKAEIERQGAVVKLVFHQELRPQEAKLIKEFAETRTKYQDATIKVIEALVAKTPLPEESLAVFVGVDMAKWMVAPRATKEDCASLRTKLQKLDDGNMSPELFALKFKLKATLEDDACVGTVLPADTKKCRLDATTVNDFAACKLPTSPYSVVARDKLVGSWTMEDYDLESSASMSYGMRKALQTCRLEISKETLKILLEDESVDAKHEVSSADFDHAQVNLPFPKKTLRWQVSFIDDDKITVGDFIEGVSSATFTRSKGNSPPKAN